VNTERSTALAVALLMVLVGAVAWGFQLRPALQVDAIPLANLPTRIEEWSSRELPLDQNVESMLRADFNVQRAFLHPMGDVVWLYIGYYGTDRGGTPEHTPPECYRAHGWSLSDPRTLVVDRPRGFRANEAVAELEGEQRLVLFWYRSYRRTGILGTFGLSVDQLIGRLTKGRADGALVRLSTPLEEGGESAARSRLASFARNLDAEIDRHWPTEVPVRRSP
jgi:EpsI family protein